GKESLSEALLAISGKLKKEVNPKACWFAVEKDLHDPQCRQRHLVVELAKKLPGRPWTDAQPFHDQMFNRQAFNWTQQQEALNTGELSSWVSLRPGRRRDVEDPFVTSRSWLCNELEQGQSREHVYFRVVLEQKKLDEALEKIPYYRLFGADTSTRFFKLFIRGDESSPILLGELGGEVVPDQTTLELTKVTREVEGHRIKGTTETLPC
ncbi:unnamed protein product, partial [Polarella glacialis]